MYLTFYGLKERPFNATPIRVSLTSRLDTARPWPNRVQRAGERGFLVLTGEVGTARPRSFTRSASDSTASGGCARLQLDAAVRRAARFVLEELGVPHPRELAGPATARPPTLHARRRRAGQNTVLILDEAQNLDTATLEKIRMLSNLETPTEKLLQILLVGQPELWAKLDRPELRQLLERIELRCGLSPLSRDQIRGLCHDPARCCGQPHPRALQRWAHDRIAAYSRGIPRRVNILCEHCLVIGYADQRRRIDVDIVDQAIESLQGAARRPARRPALLARTTRARWFLGAAPARCSPGSPWRRCVSKPRISSRSRATCATCFLR